MNDADMKARLTELYLPPANQFVLVDVPDMRYLMIDGINADDRIALDQAMKWLLATIQPAKRMARERMGKDFVEPPLEGLWWADDTNDLIHGRRDKLHWRMMIVYEPDWLLAEWVEDGIVAATAALGQQPPSLRLERYHEGLSAQTMHVGDPKAIAATTARLHKEFLPAHQLAPSGHHHEIYMTDPKRTVTDKMKTVVRQPVRRINE